MSTIEPKEQLDRTEKILAVLDSLDLQAMPIECKEYFASQIRDLEVLKASLENHIVSTSMRVKELLPDSEEAQGL